MIKSLLLAVGQVGDPAFRRPILVGALLALLGGLALVGLTSGAVNWLAGGEGWIATAAATAGGLLALLAAWWLFVPLLLAIASVLTDGVAAAVERRHYPDLPPAQGAPVAAQIWSGLALALRLALVTLLLLPLLLVPPFGAIALWAVAAVGLGEGLFLGVAQRRMSVAESKALKRRLRLRIWMLGGVLALAGIVAPLNLLVPVLGTAAMVHLLQRRDV